MTIQEKYGQWLKNADTSLQAELQAMDESAKEDAANLHRNTLDYIDSLLAETDRKMSELINNIRLERNEIRNRR